MNSSTETAALPVSAEFAEPVPRSAEPAPRPAHASRPAHTPADPIDIHGQPITRADLNRSMSLNIWAGLFGTIWGAMAVNYTMVLFMEAIGASGRMIGLLMTARLLMLAVQVPSALWFENLPEHLGSRKRYWFGAALLHRLLWFAVAGLALCEPGASWLPLVVILIIGLSDLANNTISSLWFSWMTDLIPNEESGKFWGRRQALCTVGSLGGMIAAGLLLDVFRLPETGRTSPLGFSIVLGVAAAFGIADVLVNAFIREPRRTPVAREHGKRGQWLAPLLAPFRNADFMRLTLCAAVWTAAFAMTGFYLIYLKRGDLNELTQLREPFPVGYIHIAALGIIGSLGAMAMSALWGKMADKFGARTLCAWMLFALPFASINWFFVNKTYVAVDLSWLAGLPLPAGLAAHVPEKWYIPQVVLSMAVPTFCSGAIAAALFPCQIRLLSQLSSPSGRTIAIAIHWAVVGLVASLGSMLGGGIMDWATAHPLGWRLPTGIPFSFLHVILLVFALLIWGVSIPLVLSIKAPVDKQPLGPAMVQLVNPFNVVRSVATLRWAREVVLRPVVKHKRRRRKRRERRAARQAAWALSGKE